jgi:hypothetical protein
LTFFVLCAILSLKGGDFYMAIFNPGPAVASVSGSVGGTVFSRNKGGAYMRNRAVPVTSQSEKALKYKSALAAIAASWRSVSAANRASWASYAASTPYTNRLGMSKQLSALNHFVKLNTRLLVAGDTGITTPPVGGAPSGVTVSGFVVDANLTEDSEVAFATSPIAATERLWIRAAKVNSSSILNVENLLTELIITAKAVTTPVDLQAALIAAFGTIQAGSDYILEVRVLDTSTGYMSNRVFIRTTAIDTP